MDELGTHLHCKWGWDFPEDPMQRCQQVVSVGEMKGWSFLRSVLFSIF